MKTVLVTRCFHEVDDISFIHRSSVVSRLPYPTVLHSFVRYNMCVIVHALHNKLICLLLFASLHEVGSHLLRNAQCRVQDTLSRSIILE